MKYSREDSFEAVVELCTSHGPIDTFCGTIAQCREVVNQWVKTLKTGDYITYSWPDQPVTNALKE